MAIDLNRYKRKKEEAVRGNGGGKFWRPPDKKKTPVRIFLFKHKITQADFDLGRYSEVDDKKVGQTTEELDCPTSVHFQAQGKPSTCEAMLSGMGCSLCDEAATMGDDGKRLSAKNQHVMNIVDMSTGKTVMQEWAAPNSTYEKILGFVLDEEYDNLFGCNGRDFVIDFDKDRTPANMYQVRLRDEGKCKKLPKSVEAAVKDLMSSANYVPASIADAFDGSTPDPEKEEQEDTGEIELDGATVWCDEDGEEVLYATTDIDHKAGTVTLVSEDGTPYEGIEIATIHVMEAEEDEVDEIDEVDEESLQENNDELAGLGRIALKKILKQEDPDAKIMTSMSDDDIRVVIRELRDIPFEDGASDGEEELDDLEDEVSPAEAPAKGKDTNDLVGKRIAFDGEDGVVEGVVLSKTEQGLFVTRDDSGEEWDVEPTDIQRIVVDDKKKPAASAPDSREKEAKKKTTSKKKVTKKKTGKKK
jgi:hypothetical protein